MISKFRVRQNSASDKCCIFCYNCRSETQEMYSGEISESRRLIFELDGNKYKF